MQNGTRFGRGTSFSRNLVSERHKCLVYIYFHGPRYYHLSLAQEMQNGHPELNEFLFAVNVCTKTFFSKVELDETERDRRNNRESGTCF